MNLPVSSPISSARTDQPPVSYGSLMEFPANPIACMKRLQAEFGEVAALEEDGQRLAFVFSPERNRQVLADSNTFHSRFFAVRGGRRSAQRRVTSGLLSQNGAEHRDGRRAMMDVFTKRMLPAYHDTITQLTSDMMASWQIGDVRDLNADMVHLMLQLTNALLFGIDDADYSLELGDKIDRWVRLNHEVGMGAMVASSQASDGYDRLLSMAEDVEASVHEMFGSRRNNTEGRVDILSLLMQGSQGEQGLSKEQLVGHATLLFAAAHLTTAHTLSWTLFLLAQHPDVMAKLREELSGTDDNPAHAEIESLSYLDQVIHESMRVLPASSYSQRVTTQPVQLGPRHLPPLTPVIFSQFITHHSESLYSEPDVFRPERWETISPNSYEYLPFGGGPRRCIGAPLAMVELRTALTTILKQFHFQIVPSARVDGQVVSTMLGPTTTVPATLLNTQTVAATSPVTGSIHDLVQLPDVAVETRRTAA